MDLKKIIEDSLNIPALEAFRPVIPPCATYYTVVDENGLFGDGQEEEGIESYQVDIWDRNSDSVKQMARTLKASLVSPGIGASIPYVSYLYDNNGKMWRATLTFSCVREE